MCGIAGVIGPVAEPEQIGQEMTRRLHHRGPEASGVRCLVDQYGEPIGVFAHTRLKIIDLSEGGAQPYSSPDKRVHLVFNGEIYNFLELRTVLQARGYVFRSKSDTEVIIAQYLEHGVRGLDQLDGMFAFALWDERENALILMRDRLGKKPLYWTKLPGGGLVFASEAKALSAVEGVVTALDSTAIPTYLIYGYVPTPRSIYKGVFRLAPGSRLQYRPGNEPKIERYWRALHRPVSASNFDIRGAKRKIRDVIGRAVERRLIADVPVGAFLSGGIDSSIIVAEMAARASHPVRTFSVGFDDDTTYDETKYARAVARQFGTQHTELRLKPDAGALFDRLLYHHDEPYGDSSALAVYAIAEATREHVTVVLTGDGGDEVFAGYSRFLGGVLKAKVPDVVARALKTVLERFPEPRGYKHPVALARRFVEHAGRSKDEQLLAWNAYFAGGQLAKILRKDVYDDFDPWSPMASQASLLEEAKAVGHDRLGQILIHNLETYLLDDLLVKTDRMTMAVALEARSPFLDTELVELVFGLPSHWKIAGRELKWILREAYRDILGPEILDRPKHGFGVPVGRWWSGPLRSLVSELFSGSAAVYDYLDARGVRALIDEHHSGYRDHGQRIFALVQLEMFLRRKPEPPAKATPLSKDQRPAH